MQTVIQICSYYKLTDNAKKWYIAKSHLTDTPLLRPLSLSRSTHTHTSSPIRKLRPTATFWSSNLYNPLPCLDGHSQAVMLFVIFPWWINEKLFRNSTVIYLLRRYAIYISHEVSGPTPLIRSKFRWCPYWGVLLYTVREMRWLYTLVSG